MEISRAIPVIRRSAAIVLLLLAAAGFAAGTPSIPPDPAAGQAGVWTPSDFEREEIPVEWAVAKQFGSRVVMLEWDVTDQMTAPGKCRVSFIYTKGRHGLDVRSVVLLEDGVEMARDIHDGFTGGAGNDADYVLDIPASKAGAAYTLRVEAAGRGGTDSYGSVWTVWPPAKQP